MIKTVEIQGLKELDTALRLLPTKLSRNVQLAAMRKAVRPLLSKIKANTPKDEGILAKSIGIVSDSLTKNASFYLAIRKGKNIRYDGWYGWFVHEGTRGFGKRKKHTGDLANRHSTPKYYYASKGTGLKPKRFFWPVVESELPKLISSINEAYSAYIINYLKKKRCLFNGKKSNI